MDTRSRMCHGGWEVWVHGVSAIICISELIIVRYMVSYYVCCRNMCTYKLILYICNIIQNIVSKVIVKGSLIYFSCYYLYCIVNQIRLSVIYLYNLTK